MSKGFFKRDIGIGIRNMVLREKE